MPKILFATDGSEASLHAARGLAAVLRWWRPVALEIVNVQPESSLASELLPHALRERAAQRVREEGDRALTEARAILLDAAGQCTTTLRYGEPATQIAAAAETFDGAIIAMGSHGVGAVGSLLTGSVTTKVIHTALRPVLVIPSARPQTGSTYGPPQRPARILVPVDGSAGATAAVREVVGIAAWFRDSPEVHLLTVYDRTPLDVEFAAMVSAEALREYQQQRFDATLRTAREALSLSQFKAIEHTAVGPPAAEIRATIAAERCDLVCLGTRGMGAARNLLLGSTTAKVLRSVDVPVLVVPIASDGAPGQH